MNLLIPKSSTLAVVVTGLIASNAYADKIDDALIAAYKRGYQDGLNAKDEGGGGVNGSSKRNIVGINVPFSSGGSTSGKEVPWVYKFDKSTNVHQLFENDNSPSQSWNIKEIENKGDILKKFIKSEQSKGLIVIEDLPMADFNKLENVLKNSGSGDIWIAPASK